MDQDMDSHFFGLIFSLASAAMQQLGKVPNPGTSAVEQNLAQAQMTIDLLIMVKQKTKGNLTAKEEQFLANTLTDLQLNYADEVSKKQESAPTPTGKKE